jgi:hypothetical protein
VLVEGAEPVELANVPGGGLDRAQHELLRRRYGQPVGVLEAAQAHLVAHGIAGVLAAQQVEREDLGRAGGH